MSLLGIFLVLLVFVVGIGWLVVGMTGRSFTSDEDQSDEIEGLSGEVSIVRDSYGVPYIKAANENDAMAALGYAHAQDRLWQMDMFRRFGQGRLSELLGSKLIAFDAFSKTIGFERIAQDIYAKMPGQTKSAVDAYCRGVNAFIENNRSRYSFEFDALGYEPEPWTPIHTVIVVRLLAWEQNTAFWTDLVFEGLRSRIDSARLAEVSPWYPSYGPTIIPGGQSPEPLLESLRAGAPPPSDTTQVDSTGTDSTAAKPDSARAGRNAISSFYQSLEPLIDLDCAMRESIGIGGSGVGSNAWAIAGDRTVTGKPLLANDPHLQHSAPSKWYQAVLMIGNRTVAGVTVPGMPFVVAGRNNDIAWGITNLMTDESDFYLEKTDTKDRVLHDGKWEKLTLVRDTIRTKDTLSTPITVRVSRHGPLLSDLKRLIRLYPPPLIDSAVASALVTTPSDSFALAIRWLGRDVSQELTALQRVNKAGTFKEFKDGLNFGGIPGLSLIYADRKGTIGYVPCVRAPIRGDANPNRINPGWESRFNWKGSRSVSEMPTMENPKQGYIASANNKPSNSLPFSVGDLWVDPSRAMRIEQYLSQGNTFEVLDCVQMQGDVLSEHMAYMTEFLLRAFPDSAAQGKKVREALGMLRRWNGEMGAESPEGAIAAEWAQTVYTMTWRDEMGPNLFGHFMLTPQLPLKSIRRQLMTDSRWFDDIATPEREVRDDILRKALGEALESLHKRFGTWELPQWRFGAMHTLTFPHPFSMIEPLRKVVNIGPFEVGGTVTTLNNGEWNFNKPYEARLGPSMRQIVDFADTSIYLRSVLTTGQSGQPMNDHYQDQTIIYLFSGYVSLYNHLPAEEEVLSVTTLTGK